MPQPAEDKNSELDGVLEVLHRVESTEEPEGAAPEEHNMGSKDAKEPRLRLARDRDLIQRHREPEVEVRPCSLYLYASRGISP